MKSALRCGPVRSSACWGPTARASPPLSACSAACPGPLRATARWTAWICSARQRRAFAPGLYGPEILALSRHRGEGQHQHFRGSLRPGQKTPGRAAARAGRGPGAQGFSAQPHRGPAAGPEATPGAALQPPCTNRRCFFWTNPPPEWTPAPGATSGSTSWP